MRVYDLIRLLELEDPGASVEFVHCGEHFSVEGLLRYDVSGWNSVELYGSMLTREETGDVQAW